MIEQRPSGNFGPRRAGMLPELIVLHYTAMQSAEAAIARLSDPQAEVSAHYVIDRYGKITQLVDETMRAWHAGAGSWQGRDDVNSRSIGIELDNAGTHPFSAPLMSALEGLLSAIMARWNIAPEGVIGHSDLAPGRKIDPGARFDWKRLSKQNLAAASVPQGCRDKDYRILAAHAGYDENVALTELRQAVRLRWCPHVTGPLCKVDFDVLQK